MSKELKFEIDARNKLMSGLSQLARAVKSTLGPSGKTVLIANEHGMSTITKDGVTVAKSVELEDPAENQGAQLAKEVSSKTNDSCGDGTTTSVVLAEAIAREGLKNIAAGADAFEVKVGIDRAVEAIVDQLDKIAIPVKDKDAILNVGQVSGNGEYEIGKIIADAMEKVGNDGVITVEESRTAETVLDVVEGMQFSNGYLSPYFATNEKAECVLENPYILLYSHKVMTMKDLMNHLELANGQSRPIVIIAEDVDNEALAGLVMNKLRGVIKVVAVRAPGYGDSRQNNLRDIAVLTGSTLVCDELGVSLAETGGEVLGTAKCVRVTKDSTTIVDGAGNPEQIAEHVAQLKSLLESASSEYEKEQLKTRIAKLTSGIAVIKVGAATEVEMNEKKDRIDDAYHATQAAVEEGIVPGGGTALIRAEQNINWEELENDAFHHDIITGMNIVRKAIEAPLRQIVENGGNESSVVVNKVKELKGNEGYDARGNKYYDLVEVGIIDPVKVTKHALKNAASIAGLILMTNCIIVEKKEKKQEMQMSMPIPGMM